LALKHGVQLCSTPPANNPLPIVPPPLVRSATLHRAQKAVGCPPNAGCHSLGALPHAERTGLSTASSCIISTVLNEWCLKKIQGDNFVHPCMDEMQSTFLPSIVRLFMAKGINITTACGIRRVQSEHCNIASICCLTSASRLFYIFPSSPA
jgi:hypothetical protein